MVQEGRKVKAPELDSLIQIGMELDVNSPSGAGWGTVPVDKWGSGDIATRL